MGPAGDDEAELEQLLRALGALRVTLRVRAADGTFPVVAEALDGGATSLTGTGADVDARTTAGFRWLQRERRLLVQSDCAVDEPRALPGFIERYGARSQMVAPLLADGVVVGALSVHSDVAPRTWTDDERAVLQSTVDRVQARL